MSKLFSRIKQVFVVCVIVAAVQVLTSCEKYSYNPPAVDPNTTWHLQTDIQPIFNSNCVTCHGGTVAPDLREGKSFQSLTRGGYVTTPAESSRLYTKMTDPSHAARSTAAEKLKVLYWIQQGAQNN